MQFSVANCSRLLKEGAGNQPCHDKTATAKILKFELMTTIHRKISSIEQSHSYGSNFVVIRLWMELMPAVCRLLALKMTPI